jgi:hypothetical protein
MYVLIVVIVGIWGYMLFGGGEPEAPRIPQAYISEVDGELTIYEEVPGMRPPFEDKNTGEMTAWEAWTCTNPEHEEVIFPKKWDPVPEGVTPPEEMDPEDLPEEAVGPDGEPYPEAMVSEEWMMYESEQQMKIPECPICGSTDPELVQRYLTPEAKEIIEELKARYQKNKD